MSPKLKQLLAVLNETDNFIITVPQLKNFPTFDCHIFILYLLSAEDVLIVIHVLSPLFNVIPILE